MHFKSYAERINVISKSDNQGACAHTHTHTDTPTHTNRMLEIKNKNTEMKMTRVSKVKFANLNDKRYYFLD